MADRPEVRILGPLEVWRDGALVPPGGARQRMVLAVLALADGSVVPADEIADAVWGDDALDRSKGTLQVYASNLRRVLGAGPEAIVARPPGYALDVERVAVDAQAFGAEVDEARRRAATSPTAAMDDLGRALGRWRGPVAADLEAAALDAHRNRLDQLRHDAEELRWEAALAADRHREVLDELEEGCRRAPLREQRWATLMVALYRSDRQADALDAYQQARAVLVDELGIEPGPRLRRLEQSVLVQSESLLAPGEESGPTLSWIGPDGRRHVHRLDPSQPAVIGRDPSQAEVTLGWDAQASRTHAAVEPEGEGWVLVDRGSTNGTFHNGTRIEAPAPLDDGDVLRVGDTTILVRLGGARPGLRSFVLGDTIPFEG